jgi:hypothetical protein
VPQRAEHCLTYILSVSSTSQIWHPTSPAFSPSLSPSPAPLSPSAKPKVLHGDFQVFFPSCIGRCRVNNADVVAVWHATTVAGFGRFRSGHVTLGRHSRRVDIVCASRPLLSTALPVLWGFLRVFPIRVVRLDISIW